MSSALLQLNRLRRPRLLLRAARLGVPQYCRARTLKRLLPDKRHAPGEQILRALLILEQDLDHARRARDAQYESARHVEVLIALLSEAGRLAAVPAIPFPGMAVPPPPQTAVEIGKTTW